MQANDPVVIVSASRTPMGGLMGDLSGKSANELGAIAIQKIMDSVDLNEDRIERVIMGNVLMAGQGQAPARQAALKAGLPMSTQAVTVNKMCGSGMQSIADAAAAIKAGDIDFAIAGGMESMSGAPHLLPSGRGGIKYGHGQVLDHMALDGLEDAYEPGTSMGVYADRLAKERQISRQAQDDYAIASLERAQNAVSNGYFDDEIAPVTVQTRKAEIQVTQDQLPGKLGLRKYPICGLPSAKMVP